MNTAMGVGCLRSNCKSRFTFLRTKPVGLDGKCCWLHYIRHIDNTWWIASSIKGQNWKNVRERVRNCNDTKFYYGLVCSHVTSHENEWHWVYGMWKLLRCVKISPLQIYSLWMYGIITTFQVVLGTGVHIRRMRDDRTTIYNQSSAQSINNKLSHT